jgi:DNA-binding transcriptional LysR family regulator
MDLILLRSLVAVADAGTITGAAERINVSQSALSRRLQQLEADLGVELLLRGRHGVELTDLGRQTVERGRGIIARYDELRLNVSEHLDLNRGTVRVGGGATVTSFLLPGAMAQFHAQHPGVHFYVKESGSREIASDVAAGNLELGVVTLPVPSRDLDITHLVVDDVVLIAPADHDLGEDPVPVRHLEGRPFVSFDPGSAIRQIIDRNLRAAGVEVDVVMELRSIPTILRMVVVTGNLAFVSRLSLTGETGVRQVAVRGLRISRTLGLAKRRGIPLSAPAQTFAGLLVEHAAGERAAPPGSSR